MHETRSVLPAGVEQARHARGSALAQPWRATPQYSLDPPRHTFTNTCTHIWAHTYARPQPTLHHVRGSNVRTGYEPPRIYGVDRLRACTPLWGEQVTSLRFPPGAEALVASPVPANQAAKESVFVKLGNTGSLDDRPWQGTEGLQRGAPEVQGAEPPPTDRCTPQT